MNPTAVRWRLPLPALSGMASELRAAAGNDRRAQEAAAGEQPWSEGIRRLAAQIHGLDVRAAAPQPTPHITLPLLSQPRLTHSEPPD